MRDGGKGGNSSRATEESAGEGLDAGLVDGGVLQDELEGRRSGRAVVDKGDGLGCGVEGDRQVGGTTGRGRGRSGWPVGVCGGAYRKAAGSGRRGGRVSDDGEGWSGGRSLD